MVSYLLIAALLAAPTPVEKARDRQDRPALERSIQELSTAAASSPEDAEAHYRLAVAYSYLAEVALELHDKQQAQRAAESGIEPAEKAIRLKPGVAEYYRVLGTLCGQVIPANILAGFGYGRRAREAINKAIQLDPLFSRAYVARGVGNYYLPAALGGGTGKAIADFHNAIELDPNSADAYLWLGLALRKSHQNAEARQAFTQSLKLDPARVWAKLQLEKTPAQ